MEMFKTFKITHSYNAYKEAEKFAGNIPEETWNKMSNLLFKNSFIENCRDLRISRLSRDFFQKEQVFYHGEEPYRKTKSYKLDENQVWCEEMGDGLYISPSKKVAAFWAGLRGKIFKIKLNTDKIAQADRKQMNVMVNVIANNVEDFMTNPTGQRLNVIIRTLFTKNGYDAAYAPKTMGNAFEDAVKFFDSVTGGQQQLAVYNSKVIEILPKSTKERFTNQMLQIKSYIRYCKTLLAYKSGFECK